MRMIKDSVAPTPSSAIGRAPVPIGLFPLAGAPAAQYGRRPRRPFADPRWNASPAGGGAGRTLILRLI
jgi:hypothetical protein